LAVICSESETVQVLGAIACSQQLGSQRKEPAHTSGGIKGAGLSQTLRFSLSTGEERFNSVQSEKSPAQ